MLLRTSKAQRALVLAEWRKRRRWLTRNRALVAKRGMKILEAGQSEQKMLETIAAEFGYEQRDIWCLAAGIAYRFRQRWTWRQLERVA